MRFLSEGMLRTIGQKSLAFNQRSPGILFGVGVAAMGASTVMACRATLRVEEILEKGQADLAKIKSVQNVEEYTDTDRKKDTVIVYTRTAVDLFKLYTPAVLLGLSGIAALTTSHHILTQRNAAITAAYAAIDRAFTQYRERVVGRYGEETDLEMRYGVETVEATNPETGRKKAVKRVSDEEPTMYAKFFDKQSGLWSKDPEINYVTVRAHQRYANDLLTIRGHVFLNEVYDMFDIPRTEAGAVVGWRLTEHAEGDNFIDFGLFRDDDTVRDFMNGREGSILLDFNVDGVIFDKIEPGKERLSWQKD